MFLELGLFVAGFALLIKGADLMVDSSVKIAKHLRISEFIIALTIVAIGTSLPELATGITSAFYNTTAITVGNVIGASISNLALITGLGGLIVGVIVFEKKAYFRDGFAMLCTVLLFYLLSLDGTLSRWDGLLLVLLFAGYMFYLMGVQKKLGQEFGLFMYHPKIMSFSEIKDDVKKIGQLNGLGWQFAILAIGLVAVVIGANFVVTGTSAFPIPKIVTGLVLVSFGTTLPELSVAISALRKKHYEIIIGDSVGSVIVNVLLVGGIAALARPLPIPEKTISMHLPIFVIITLLYLLFMRKDFAIKRHEAAVLFFCQFVFIAISFLL